MSFRLFLTVTTISKLNMERSVRLEIELNLKISHRWFMFFKQRIIELLHVAVSQRTTKKCTKKFVIPPNSNTFSDLRKTCHVPWFKTHSKTH